MGDYGTSTVPLFRVGGFAPAVLDSAERQPGISRLLQWALESLAPNTGEQALDIGSGTGPYTRKLSRATGRLAVGIEPDQELRQVADNRAIDAHASCIFIDGDACDLPFPENSFDVVLCSSVFQLLAEPQLAANEALRVLRPGGRVAVIAPDFGSVLISPGDPRVSRAVLGDFTSRMRSPFVGRKLAELLTEAGGIVIGTSGELMVQSAEVVDRVFESANTTVDSGRISSAERDKWLAELHAAADRSTMHFSSSLLAVCAHKS